MQALRHCRLCAPTGLLPSRTDFRYSEPNMAAPRGGATLLSLSRRGTTAFCSNRNPTRQLLRALVLRTTDAVALSFGSALCTAPFLQHTEHLSHESLIRRASCLLTDSSSTFLSQTSLALSDALALYTKALHTLMALQKRYLSSLGKLSPAEEDGLWQVIIAQRVEVGERLEDCKRFEVNWMNAVSLCELSAEAAFSSGAEHAAVALRTTLTAAQSKLQEMRELRAVAEKSLAEIKAEEIQRMAEYASSIKLHDLEDIPEAYLPQLYTQPGTQHEPNLDMDFYFLDLDHSSQEELN